MLEILTSVPRLLRPGAWRLVVAIFLIWNGIVQAGPTRWAILGMGLIYIGLGGVYVVAALRSRGRPAFILDPAGMTAGDGRRLHTPGTAPSASGLATPTADGSTGDCAPRPSASTVGQTSPSPAEPGTRPTPVVNTTAHGDACRANRSNACLDDYRPHRFR
jgi:hypothetical protein